MTGGPTARLVGAYQPATCRHGREGVCAYCLSFIRASDFFEMMRWRAALRRKGKAVRRGS